MDESVLLSLMRSSTAAAISRCAAGEYAGFHRDFARTGGVSAAIVRLRSDDEKKAG